jgi:hypothetical protein
MIAYIVNKFDSWVEVKEGFLLPKVWVRVFGMRKELREFLDLWAIGSLLGSTQTVDMETTRKDNFARIMVAVLNPKLIPPHLDVVTGDHYFELEFEVENLGTDESGEEVEVEWSKEGGGDGDYSGSPEKDEEGMRDHKKLRAEGAVNGREAAVVADKAPEPACLTGVRTQGRVPESWKEMVHGMSMDEFNLFLREKAKEIVGMSMDIVLDDLANKVMEEGDEELSNSRLNNSELGLVGAEAGKNAIGTTEGLSGSVEIKKNELKVMASAAILEASTPQVHSSPRLAGVTDEHAMDGAQRRAAAKDGDPSNGTCSSVSHDFPFCELINGIGLNCLHPKETIERSLQSCLEVGLVSDQKVEVEGGDPFDQVRFSDAENLDNLEQLAVKSLCIELLEELYDDHYDQLSCDFNVVGTARKPCAKSRKRQACRVRTLGNSRSRTVSK